MKDYSKVLPEIQFLQVRMNMEAKASTAGADRAVNKVALGVAIAVIILAACIGLAILIPALVGSGLLNFESN